MRIGLALSLCTPSGALTTPVVASAITFAATAALAVASATVCVDPTTLALSQYLRGSFAGSPWTGVASAGLSGGRTVSEATNPPSAGTTVNTFAPAAFDGTNDVLQNTSLAGVNYFSASAYTIVVMVKPHAGAAAAANAYQDQFIVGCSGDILGLVWSTSGVRAFHYDGTNFNATAWKACSADAWHMVAVTFSGGVLSISVDQGTAATVSKGNVNGLNAGSLLTLAKNSAAAFTSEQIMELMTATTALSATNLTNLQAYFKARYPAASLP